jgi:hypothetical protein
MVLLIVTSATIYPQMTEQVDLGPVRGGTKSHFTIEAQNNTTEEIRFFFVSTCPCIRPESKELYLAPNSTETVPFSFDSTGYSGKVARSILVSSSNQLYNNSLITVSAEVTVSNGGNPDVESSAAPCPTCEEQYDTTTAERYLLEHSRQPLYIHFYADKGCRECTRFVEKTVPKIRSDGCRPFIVVQHDLMAQGTMEELLSRLKELEIGLEQFPMVIADTEAGSAVFQGLEQIETRLAELLQTEAAGGMKREAGALELGRGTATAETASGLSIAAVALAGLADGVNPCAFSTILFLISMLSLIGRTKKEILTVGIVFTVTVFAGYFAVGLGLFGAVRSLLIFPMMVSAIRWVLIALLLVLASLSVRDAVLASRGRTKEMTLQLSDKMKRRVHRVVRTRVRRASMITGTAVIALLVTIFEFSCTGQVYLPIIMHLARTEGHGDSYALLALYNGAFILPLLLVFGISYAGAAMDSIAAFFSRRVAAVKALLAVVFLGMAVLTILT